jgi:predicted ATPase/DNA-binding winged helix-turn-helix (wHTH) protein
MVLCFGDYELDDQQFELRADGMKVPVQPKVLDVLFHLVRARDRVVLKKELLDSVWPGVVVSEASISRVIMEARKAIGDELHQLVVTVRGRGFRFTAEVTERDRSVAPKAAEPPIDPTFVGRAACLAAAEAKLDEALAGQGSTLWLSGEAGIGKSRTAEEVARRARLRGATILFANAHETPESPPLWLWTQIIRAYATSRQEGSMRGLLQQVAPLMTGGPLPTGGAEFKLFDAVARLLKDASEAQPLVLVLDDLHWSDEGSLRLLQFVVRELRQAAVLTVATYRDTGLKSDAIGRALGDLLRERGSVSIPLRGLSLEETAKFVEVATGSTPSPELSRMLLERSGGNPLYMQQLLRTEWAERALAERAHALASSMDLQQGLIESICRHVDSLSEPARELLTVASVLGREFEIAKLLIVFNLPQKDVFDRLDEAAQARVLVKGKDGAYRFAHALVRDVLYKKLSYAERVARHRTIGERLLAHYGNDIDAHAAELARHFYRALPAGDAMRAIDFSMRAARQDAAIGSHRSAAKHWQEAIGAFGHVKGDDARRVQVLLELARSLTLAGETAAAREAYLDAATLARTFGLAGALAEAALGFAAIAADAKVQREAVLREALTSLTASHDPATGGLEAAVQAAIASAG